VCAADPVCDVEDVLEMQKEWPYFEAARLKAKLYATALLACLLVVVHASHPQLSTSDYLRCDSPQLLSR